MHVQVLSLHNRIVYSEWLLCGLLNVERLLYGLLNVAFSMKTKACSSSWIFHKSMDGPYYIVMVTCYTFQIPLCFSLEDVVVLANNVNLDEMPHYAAFHLGLHCLSKYAFRSHKYVKGILGQVWYLIALIPDLCRLSYVYTNSTIWSMPKKGQLFVAIQLNKISYH